MSVVFDSPYPFCACEGRCGCSGPNQLSYLPEYLELLMRVSPKPKLIVEWGPGLNTALALATGATVHSIESEAKWLPRFYAPTFLWHLVPKDSSQYTEIVTDRFSDGVDLWFVDGFHRSEVLRAIYATYAAKLKTTIVCLHDAQRERYHDALRLFPYVFFLNRGLAVASGCRTILNLPRSMR